MACFPPTPKYEISLFKDLGTSATLQKKKKHTAVLVSDSYNNGSSIQKRARHE